MKDNININGIEDYITEGTNISEILRQNNKRMQELQNERNKRNKKNKLHDIIASVMVISTITIILIGLIQLINKDADKAIETCVNNGYSYESCMKGFY